MDQPQAAQPVPHATSAQLNPQKNRKILKLVLLVFTGIIILTAAITTIFFYSQLQNQPSSSLDNPLIRQIAEKLPIPKITLVPITLAPTIPSPRTTSQPPEAPAPTQDPTISLPIWKTYVNKTYNFSVEYPSELTTLEKSHSLGIIDISFTNPAGNPQNAPEYQILIYPKTIDILVGQSFEQLYNLPPQSTQLMTSEATTPQQFTKIKNTAINSLRAFDFRTTSNPPDPTEEAEVGTYIELGKNTLIISTGENNQPTLDYMLSTFNPDSIGVKSPTP